MEEKPKEEQIPTTLSVTPQNIRRALVVPAAKGIKVDRYGWQIGPEAEKPSSAELKLREKENADEEKRTKIWKEYISMWSSLSGKKRSKIQELIMQGIPDAYRFTVWKILIEPGFLNPFGFKCDDLDELIKKGSSPTWQVIEADLVRTMPHCPMFNDEKKIESLRRILYAYSNKDRELDYTQGMSFFAGFLLMYMDEKTAYQCFLQLMKGPKFQWRNYFLPQFPRLIELNKVWEVILKDQYPKIAKHFEEIGVQSLIYTPSWFLTVFLNIDFPIVVRLHILDMFFEFATKTVLSFGLAIISRHKKELVTYPFEKVLTILQRPNSTPNTKDWRYLLKKFHEKFLTDKKYQEYFAKAGVELFP